MKKLHDSIKWFRSSIFAEYLPLLNKTANLRKFFVINSGKYNMKSLLISNVSFAIFVIGLYFLADFELFYAIGFGVLLLIHELGHVFALNKLEGTTKDVYFFPFVGAIVASNKKLNTENEYAYFKYLGPLAGTVGVLITLLIFFFLKDPRFLNLVFAGVILNLINMVPLTLLDGYGILRGSIKHIEWVGFLILIVLGFFVFQEYILTLFFLLIFTLFSDSPTKEATGFKIHEVILSSIFILVMITLTIVNKESLVWNVPLVIFSIYSFGVYIKSTCFDNKKKQNDQQNTLQLLPLTKKEKILWITKWLLLVLVLLVVAFYSKS